MSGRFEVDASAVEVMRSVGLPIPPGQWARAAIARRTRRVAARPPLPPPAVRPGGRRFGGAKGDASPEEDRPRSTDRLTSSEWREHAPDHAGWTRLARRRNAPGTRF